MQKSIRNVLIGAGVLATAITATAILASSSVYNVGTGSGTLVIDGKTTPYKAGDSIKIKGGKYSGVTIQNFNTSGGPVIITNSGLVEITGNGNSMNLTNISNVVITGIGNGGNNQGFSLHDNNYRPMRWSGVFHNVQIDHFLFKNTGDYTISWDFGGTIYKDSSTSYSDIHLLNCEFANIGAMINLDGGIQNGQITGLINRLEIAYCNLHDASPGDFFSIEMAQDYNIHDNYGRNLNATNNNHNGIFHIQGTGQFINNKFQNIQGNTLRAWPVSIGTTPKNVVITNNITDSTRKYSGYEAQGFSSLIVKGKTTYANVQIGNNTVGDLDWSKDNAISAGLIDAYSLVGGTLNVTNNLIFNSYPSNTIINQEGDVPITQSGNIYQPTWKTAVTDLIAFKSLFPGIGATSNGIVVTPPNDTTMPPPIVTPPPVIIPPIKKAIQHITLYNDSTFSLK